MLRRRPALLKSEPGTERRSSLPGLQLGVPRRMIAQTILTDASLSPFMNFNLAVPNAVSGFITLLTFWTGREHFCIRPERERLAREHRAPQKRRGRQVDQTGQPQYLA